MDTAVARASLTEPRNSPDRISVSNRRIKPTSLKFNTMSIQDFTNNITLGIKSFERPGCVERLYRSIRRYYPTITIMVCDDSAHPELASQEMRDDPNLRFFPVEFDVGISAGRNLLVNATSTKYYVTLDDDVVFTEKTDLGRLHDFLERHPEVTLAGGMMRGLPQYRLVMHARLEGRMYASDSPGHYGVLDGFMLTNRGHNFFMARTKCLQELLWNEQLKILEHTEFFVRAWKAAG